MDENETSISMWARLCSENEEVRDHAMKEYRAWREDPVTRDMLAHIRDMINGYLDAPLPADAMTGNTITSEQRMWNLHGMREVERRLSDMREDAIEAVLIARQRGKQEDLNRANSDFYDPQDRTEGE